MPEPPDFEQLAVQISGGDMTSAEVAEQLRLIWNARGAADRAMLDAYLSRKDDGTGMTVAIVSVEAFDRALRSLDR